VQRRPKKWLGHLDRRKKPVRAPVAGKRERSQQLRRARPAFPARMRKRRERPVVTPRKKKSTRGCRDHSCRFEMARRPHQKEKKEEGSGGVTPTGFPKKWRRPAPLYSRQKRHVPIRRKKTEIPANREGRGKGGGKIAAEIADSL